MGNIISIEGREIFDSRGNPTLEVEVWTDKGAFGVAGVPSGASTGSKEALELRDKDPNYMNGKGVFKAIENVRKIGEKIIDEGIDVRDQIRIDKFMVSLDKTPNKSHIGGNVMIGISMAVARAASMESNLPLYKYLGGPLTLKMPIPMFNVINGGKHAHNNLDFQEFMIVPVKGDTFRDKLRMGISVYHNLRKILEEKGYSTGVGDEGGFAPNLKSHDEAIEILIKAIEKSGYEPGNHIYISLDIAASELWDEKNKVYVLKGMNKKISSEEMIRIYEEYCLRYPLLSIEDPMSEYDEEGWQELKKAIKDKVMIVGDDLTVTNASLIQKYAEMGIISGVIIKPNQIGTVSETLTAIETAHRAGLKCIVSHRSGETNDAFISDLAVAMSVDYIKAGAPCRGERMAKYNRLLEIENENML